MGTAIIESHLGGGKYRVRLQFDNAIIQQRIANIDARLAEITAKLAELATEKAEAKTKLDADVLALNVYIDATPPQDYAANPTQIDKLTAALYESKSAYDLVVSHENRENLQKAGLEKEKTYLTKYCPAEITTDIWCVQLIGNLTGTIKTIECDYGLERDPDTNVIKFDTGIWLPYQATAPDSKLQHPMATSQHANWFNLSMLPAAQRDKALYRVATLLNVATGRIQFDGQFNTQEHNERLFNQSPIFPVIGGAQREFYDGAQLYNPCDPQAVYQNNDRVIVDLHGGVGVPTVIGFYSNPRACPSVPAVYYEYWPFEQFVTARKEGILIDGLPYAELYYQFTWTLTADYCAGHGLTYPHNILSFPEELIATLPGIGSYYTVQRAITQPNPSEGSIEFVFSVTASGLPDYIPTPDVHVARSLSFIGGFSDSVAAYSFIEYAGSGLVKVRVAEF